MILCGINFNLYFLLGKRGGIKSFFRDSELKLYLGIIFACSLLITVDLLATGTYDSVSDSVRDSAFQVSSIITTTGYMTADYDTWPTFSKMLIFLVLLQKKKLGPVQSILLSGVSGAVCYYFIGV